MTATGLKIIAVICMTLDHLSTYLNAPLPLRYIGRIAAVIFFSARRKVPYIRMTAKSI